jgi:hypothetical protein
MNADLHAGLDSTQTGPIQPPQLGPDSPAVPASKGRLLYFASSTAWPVLRARVLVSGTKVDTPIILMLRVLASATRADTVQTDSGPSTAMLAVSKILLQAVEMAWASVERVTVMSLPESASWASLRTGVLGEHLAAGWCRSRGV